MSIARVLSHRRATAALTAPAARCRLRRHTTTRRTTTTTLYDSRPATRVAGEFLVPGEYQRLSPLAATPAMLAGVAGVRGGIDHKQPERDAACIRSRPSLLHRAKRGRRQRGPSPSKRLTRVSSCRRVVVLVVRAKREAAARGAAVDKRLSPNRAHSASASSGEIRAARRAGPRHARSDTPPITRAATASVGG